MTSVLPWGFSPDRRADFAPPTSRAGLRGEDAVTTPTGVSASSKMPVQRRHTLCGPKVSSRDSGVPVSAVWTPALRACWTNAAGVGWTGEPESNAMHQEQTNASCPPARARARIRPVCRVAQGSRRRTRPIASTRTIVAGLGGFGAGMVRRYHAGRRAQAAQRWIRRQPQAMPRVSSPARPRARGVPPPRTPSGRSRATRSGHRGTSH